MSDSPELTGIITSDYHTKLRDEVAMRAMVEMQKKYPIPTPCTQIAKEAYELADAFLEARKR